jgi:hypothetical protein
VALVLYAGIMYSVPKLTVLFVLYSQLWLNLCRLLFSNPVVQILSSEVNIFSANHDVHCILWNSNINYIFHVRFISGCENNKKEEIRNVFSAFKSPSWRFL